MQYAAKNYLKDLKPNQIKYKMNNNNNMKTIFKKYKINKQKMVNYHQYLNKDMAINLKKIIVK